MMEDQQKLKTVTSSTKYIDHRYSLLTSSKCALDSKFIKWIDEIKFAIENDLPEFAQYLAQLLVKEYGTHYLKKVKIGGFIYMDDYLSDTFWQKFKNSSTTVKHSSSYKFFGIFKFGGSGSSTTVTSEYESYTESVKKTKIDSVGGIYKFFCECIYFL